MMFAAPLVLVGLAALPAIFLLLRLNPPRPRVVRFPPLALLRDLAADERTPHQVPLWILLLRLLAAGLLVVGLAGPVLHPPPALPGRGPVLLVIDNGWAAAADWPARIAAANRVVSAAQAAGRAMAILTTAPGADGAPPHVLGLMSAVAAGQIVAALTPEPWPVDRLGAAAALRAAPATTRIYLADGIGGAGFPAFLQALRPDRVIASGALPGLLGPPQRTGAGNLAVRLLSGPAGSVLLAEDAGGGVLGRTIFDARGNAVISLPVPVMNKITALVLDGPGSAGGTALLDGSARVVRAGLVAAGNNADTPFLGGFYFIRRALPVGAVAVTGPLARLTAAQNIIFLVDVPLNSADQAAAARFIAGGGVLVRFAGPLTAAAPDPLTPDPQLAGDRRLGGVLSWTTPARIGPVTSGPLAGLAADPGAVVARQVLADPVALDPATVWARLSDGTPLVLGRQMGRGFLVSVLTSANTDWSNLAISGMFPALLERLAALAQGGTAQPRQALPLSKELSAFGRLEAPAGPASLTAAGLAAAQISPRTPAGLYGGGGALATTMATAMALNLGGHVPAPVAAALPGAAPLSGPAAPVGFGGALVAAAFLLLMLDLAVSLHLRGLVRRPAFLLVFLAAPVLGHAQSAAVQTSLGYLRSDDAATDQLVADGLGYISADVSTHSSAPIGAPVGLDPAVDDLGLYPLIYWMVLPDAPAPAPAACTALTSYMAHGGLLVLDTPGGDEAAPGSGAAFAPHAAAAVARVTACLNLPPLAPLTPKDTLAHCFYILPDFPGRFVGAPVWAATATARDADGVTPVVIGQNDWVGAWARDEDGNPEQTPLPDGAAQRTIADRFGTNLVIYALTGNYKADQASAPALLDKLGQ
jgi:hypothetical protein